MRMLQGRLVLEHKSQYIFRHFESMGPAWHGIGSGAVFPRFEIVYEMVILHQQHTEGSSSPSAFTYVDMILMKSRITTNEFVPNQLPSHPEIFIYSVLGSCILASCFL